MRQWPVNLNSNDNTVLYNATQWRSKQSNA
jgi:hypothetical protein